MTIRFQNNSSMIMQNIDLVRKYTKMSYNLEDFREKILDIISRNDVSLISAPTGAGKSSKIPKWLLADESKIIVTQPRRIACRCLASYVAEDVGCSLGEDVGQAMSGNTIMTPKTRILFATTGSFVKMLIKYKDSFQYTHILLDECHTRDIHMDLCLLMIKALYSRFKYWKPKVILLSATMDMNMMSTYFSNIPGKHLTIEMFQSVEAQTPYRIDRYFIEDITKGVQLTQYNNSIMMTGFKNPVDENGKIRINRDGLPDNIFVIPELLSSISKLEDERGPRDVLVFLPGIYEIRSLTNIIRGDPKEISKWLLFEAFASQEQEILDAIKEPAVFPKRKLILSTNLCESSMTIPNIGYVVDLCLTRRLEFDSTVGFNKMITSIASTSQCVQRGGRTGRTNNGIHFILTEKSFFVDKMPLHAVPEMKICWLGTVILQLKSLQIGSPRDLLKYAVTRPDDYNFIAAIKCLKQSQAMTIRMKDGTYKEDDGELTIFGTLAFELGIDIRQARLIIFSLIFDCVNYGVLMGVISVSRSVFSTHPDGDNSVNLWAKKKQIGEFVQSDILTSVSVCIKSILEPESLCEYGIRVGVCAQIMNDINSIFRKMKLHLGMELPFGYNHFKDFKPIPNQETLQMKIFILKVIIGAASYPNVFQKPKIRNVNRTRNVLGECMQHCPMSTVLLKNNDKFNPSSEIPSSEFIVYLRHELTFDGVVPDVEWNPEYNYFVCSYHNDMLKIDGVPISLFKAMKIKNMNKQLEIKKGQRRFTLNGPFSNINVKFEQTFVSYIRKGGRVIIFDRESVNCYFLDVYYTDPRDHCISSLSITTTKKGQFVAKEISTMPYITGFYEKLHLLFCQRAQLVKKQNTDKFLGAKVGMGSENGESDGLHDISTNRDACIHFSATVDDNMLVKINRIRQIMSDIWSINNSVEINQVQQEVKNDIISLLNEPSRPLDTMYVTDLHKLDVNWNLEEDTNSSSDLFPQHISVSHL